MNRFPYASVLLGLLLAVPAAAQDDALPLPSSADLRRARSQAPADGALEPTAEDEDFGETLAGLLGLGEPVIDRVALTFTPHDRGGILESVNLPDQGLHPAAVEELAGPRVAFDGLTVRRLRASSPAGAAEFAAASDEVLGDGALQVVEVRGPEVAILSGRRLDDPALARRARAAVWEARAAEGPRELLVAARGPGAYAAELETAEGSLYASLEESLRAARRQKAELARPGSSIEATWRSARAFRVVFGDQGLAAEIRVDRDGGLAALAPVEELDGLLAYLGAIEAAAPAPPAKKRAGLDDAVRGAVAD